MKRQRDFYRDLSAIRYRENEVKAKEERSSLARGTLDNEKNELASFVPDDGSISLVLHSRLFLSLCRTTRSTSMQSTRRRLEIRHPLLLPIDISLSFSSSDHRYRQTNRRRTNFRTMFRFRYPSGPRSHGRSPANLPRTNNTDTRPEKHEFGSERRMHRVLRDRNEQLRCSE